MSDSTQLLLQLRALLQVEELHGAEHNAGDDTLPLRIAAVFVILAAGLLGGLPTLFIKAFRDTNSVPAQVLRAFSAGVILALALVHIIPESVLEMHGLGAAEEAHVEEAALRRLARALLQAEEAGHVDEPGGVDAHAGYPYGGVCVLFGLVLMIFLEHAAHIFFGVSSDMANVQRRSNHISDSGTSLWPVRDLEEAGGSPTASSQDLVADKVKAQQLAKLTPTEPFHSHGHQAGQHATHAHECVSHGPASNWAVASNTGCGSSLRLQLLAVLFEFGCIFHSFIIGLALGVNSTDLTEVRALLIALAFHQWMEGISLGSVVTQAGFATWKRVSMVVLYSLTCPVGVAIGIAVAASYDEHSARTRAIQGAFNGVSGGMLLYIALVQLIAEDMGKVDSGSASRSARALSYGALMLGAALMSMLAVWA